MDGRWELKDLSKLPSVFEQCYSFVYCFDAEIGAINPERIEIALRNYPWRGGFSYVNIYTVLRNQVQWRDRPRVNEIKYASPGWIELALNLEVAVQVAQAVAKIAASAAAVAISYRAGDKALKDIKTYREKAKLKYLELTVAQDAILLNHCQTHAKFLGFRSVKELIQKTGSTEVALRLLLAHSRRLDDLAQFIDDGKIKLPSK